MTYYVQFTVTDTPKDDFTTQKTCLEAEAVIRCCCCHTLLTYVTH